MEVLTEIARPTHEERRVSDAEKYAYVDGKRVPFALMGFISVVPLLIGLWMFALHDRLIWCMMPLVIVNGVYLLLSYGVMLSGSSFSLKKHRQLLSSFYSSRDAESLADTTVDVFLPVCGEERRIVLETWAGVSCLDFPGRIEVYVLDDSPNEQFRRDAEQFGFHYLRRPTRELKKAGNLRHGFCRSSGDFILLLDADFCPRADMLTELMPYMLTDSKLAVLQTPQYFDVDSEMGWVEAGAGYVQELFYRLIQPARDRWGAAVCVGSCAVYRREALADAGGFSAIEHSEDIWTGYELMKRGWKIRYAPIVLSKGECPRTVSSFVSQQYRWCCGSLSLVANLAFWRSSLTAAQKTCYFGGLIYYLATAANVLFAPLPPLIMVWMFPELVRWYHLAFWILALLYTTFIMGIWSRHPFGFHFLSIREISAASHLIAVCDGLRGNLMNWVVTGANVARRNLRIALSLFILLACSGGAAAVVWICAIKHVINAPASWVDFAPPVFFVTMHFLLCWRALTCPTAQAALLGAQAAQFSRRFFGALRWAFIGTVRYRGVQACIAAVLLIPIIVGMRSSPSDLQLESPSIDSPSSRVASLFWLDAQRAIPAGANFGAWTVENAFPTPDKLSCAMRVRQHPRETNRYYVGSCQGIIQEVRRTSQGWRVAPVADLRASSMDFLYSFVLHPRFEENRRLFVFYRTIADDAGSYYRVSSVDLPANGVAHVEDENVLIQQTITTSEHLGGDLAFDSRGFLIISVGDGATSHSDVNSQIIDRGLFSGLLRIDVDRRGGAVSHPPPRQPALGRTADYYIPNDNPFVGEPNALEEFWAIGLRNPFRINYDASKDRVWIGEVGQDHVEQVELASAGTNHLWSFREGTQLYERSYLKGRPPAELHGRPTNPIYEYLHTDQNYCVVGGVVYSGDRFPELRGKYIFGDNQSGRIWAIDPEQPKEAELLLQLPFTKTSASLVSISEDCNGDIFFTSYASWPPVYRLKRSDQFIPPERLSQTGIFADLRTLTPSEGFIGYDVNIPLWSDGMNKRRWLRLPDEEYIDNSAADDTSWKFPPGTLFVKHFEYPADAPERPGSRLETRALLVKENGQVLGCTYLWVEDQSDAILQLDRAALSLPTPIRKDNGDDRSSFTYHLPGSNDCVVCHNRENPVLGVNLLQLNRRGTGADSAANQLVALSKRNLFLRKYGKIDLDGLPKLAPLDAEETSLQERALSYLHANCSFCHFRRGMQRVDLDLTIATTSKFVDTLFNKQAYLHYQSIDNKKAPELINPGDPESSAIYRRMQSSDRFVSMPYLGRTLPDDRAVDLIGEWIRSLPHDFQE